MKMVNSSSPLDTQNGTRILLKLDSGYLWLIGRFGVPMPRPFLPFFLIALNLFPTYLAPTLRCWQEPARCEHPGFTDIARVAGTSVFKPALGKNVRQAVFGVCLD